MYLLCSCINIINCEFIIFRICGILNHNSFPYTNFFELFVEISDGSRILGIFWMKCFKTFSVDISIDLYHVSIAHFHVSYFFAACDIPDSPNCDTRNTETRNCCGRYQACCCESKASFFPSAIRWLTERCNNTSHNCFFLICEFPIFF